MTLGEADARTMGRLEALVLRMERAGVRGLEASELPELSALVRRASTLCAREETQGASPELAARMRELLARTHRVLPRDLPRPSGRWPARAVGFLCADCPRAIRSEWQPLVAMLALFYGLAALAFAAVSADLGLAWSLLDPSAVEVEIAQLRATEGGAPFRGNFTFGLAESPFAAGQIFARNISVALLFFGAGLLAPLLLYLIALNALMVGTYTAVAGHWGQAGAISSILWCHGAIELQMLVLSGTAGLVLLRAWIAPGPYTRAHAMALESRRAFALFAPVLPLLVVSGFIEGYVSPHASLEVRLATAAGTGALLLAWVLLGGRRRA